MNEQAVSEIFGHIERIVIGIGVISANILLIVKWIKTDGHLSAQDRAIEEVQKGVNGQTEKLVQAARENAGATADAVALVVKKDAKDTLAESAAEVAALRQELAVVHNKLEAMIPTPKGRDEP